MQTADIEPPKPRRGRPHSGPARLSQSDFAVHIGKAASNVSEMKKNGRLVFDESGMVLVAESKARIEQTRRKRPTVAIAQRDDSSRLLKDRYDAENARLDYEERCGQLTPVEAVASAAFNAGVMVRTRIESMADRLAPNLAPITDENQIRAVLAEWAEALLSETAAAFAALASAARAKAKAASSGRTIQ